MKLNKIFLPFLFYITLMFGCSKDNDIELMDKSNEEAFTKSSKTEFLDAEEKPFVLLEEETVPYTVQNIITAQNILIDSGYILQPLNIATTRHYIKLLPVSWDEVDLLEDNLEKIGVPIFDFPLHYKLSEEGTYYHDASIADSMPTYQYAVVPIGFNLASYRFEVIDELFMLEENHQDYEKFSMIEDMALVMAGQWDFADGLPSWYGQKSNKKWYPRARVEALDHQLRRNVPVVGAKVVIRKGLKSHVSYTNANGEVASSKQFKGSVNFKVKWVTPSYRIRAGIYGPAWTNAGSQSSNLSLVITQNLRLLYATIHRGAHDFFYNDPFNLNKPNPFPKLKISAMDQCGTGVQHHIFSVVGGPDIKIYRKTSNNNGCLVKNTLNLYSTTLHELGHSNHRSLGVAKFAFCSGLVRESWAEAVEWAFVMWKYKTNSPNLNLTNTTHDFLNGGVTTTSFLNREHPFARIEDTEAGSLYTPFFIDLMDCSTSNSIINFTNSTTLIMNERICGYSLKQLEQVVGNMGWSADAITNLYSIRDRLVNNYTNPSEVSITPYIQTYYVPHFNN